jgi:hypothetical protein
LTNFPIGAILPSAQGVGYTKKTPRLERKIYRLERKFPLKDAITVIESLGFFISEQNSKRVTLFKNFRDGRLHCTVAQHNKIPEKVIIRMHWDRRIDSKTHIIQPSDKAAEALKKIRNRIRNRRRGLS